MVHRALPVAGLTAVLMLPVPAPAASALAGGTPAPSASGGTRYGQPVARRTQRGRRPVAKEFKVTPGVLYDTRSPPRVTFVIEDDDRRVRVRLALVREQDGAPIGSLSLGRQPTGRRVEARWPLPAGLEGSFRLRLHVVDGHGHVLRRDAQRTGIARVALHNARFPVAGDHSFGEEGSRFGAPRSPNRLHQGQDIAAAEGTPVVAPRAGVVEHRSYQARGAGYYLVIRGEDSRHYVFMHLREGSMLVEEGARVATGQEIAQVGNTGGSSGAHLHFEIWVGGWYAPGGHPIDPLPELQAWDAYS